MVDPPRPISNRAVKRGSAAGTGAVALGDKVRALMPHAYLSRRGAVAARRAHNPKVDGSNPSAATIVERGHLLQVSSFCVSKKADGLQAQWREHS